VKKLTSATKSEKLKSLLTTLFVLIVGTLLTFKPPLDPDFGWHYKYGEYAIKNSQLLKTNIFSYVTEGHPWTNNYWIAEIVLYLMYSGTSFILPALVLSFVFNLVLLYIIRTFTKTKEGLWVTMITVSSYMGMYLIVSRPLYFSSIFMLLLIYLLLEKPRGHVAIPLLIFIWVNTHADFMLGLFIIGLYTLEKLLKLYKDKELTFNNITRVLVLPVSSFLVTFINPYGIKLWLTLFEEILVSSSNIIAEWHPINTGKNLEEFLQYTVLMLVGGFCLAATFIHRKKYKIWYPVTILVFFILANKSIYFFRVFLLIATPVAASFWGSFINQIKTNIKNQDILKATKIMGKILGFMVMLMLLALILEQMPQAYNLKTLDMAGEYPREAVEYIKANPDEFEGNMFNTYEWGGYLIWRLPKHKTFIDGRIVAYRPIVMKYIESFENKDAFFEMLREHNISWILIKEDSAHAKHIVADPEFDILIKNETTVLAKVR
jgi:hypothetical protein